MSDDEVFAFVVAGVLALSGLWMIAVPLVFVRLGRKWWGRSGMVASAAAMMGLLWWVLTHLASKDVRDHWAYIALFMTAGAAVQSVVMHVTVTMGITWRDDALERRNAAAVWTVCGALVGSSLIFIGSNIGEGPTVWTTFGPACLGVGVWFLLWMCMQLCGDFAEAVAVERDDASGLRLGFALIAIGLILGRSIAGDWQSWDELFATFFREGWPTLVIAGITVVMQLLWQPAKGRRPQTRTHGLLPGGFLLSISVAWVLLLGRW